jgi:hypothetical protein
MQVRLLDAVTVGAGGKTTALFFPTVALTFDTASLSVAVLEAADVEGSSGT